MATGALLGVPLAYYPRGNGQRARMLRAVGWRTGGEAREDGRRGADGRGMHRASLAEGGRCAQGALAERARTGRAERPLNSRSADGWRKAGRIPPPRGLPTPYENEGGLVWVRTYVNRRRGVGCGGVIGAFIMAKLVGCYSHPRCFCQLSKAKRKKVPQSEAEIRPKRLENQMRL